MTEHASTANYAVSQQAAPFVSQPAHSATPVDIGFGHMGLDDVANSTSTQPLDQAGHDALSKAALFLATAGHAVAGEKIKLADYLIGEGNLLPSVTALFSTLDRVHPVDVEDINPHEQPASYKEDAVLRPCHLQADSTGHPPAVALMELFVELLAQFAEPTEAPDDLPDAHKDLLIFMSIFDAMNAKPKFRQLVTLLKKASQPPPLFESGKAANMVVIALAWGILWNRLSAKLEQASPGHVMPRPRNWTLRGSLASFVPSLYQDDESASEDQCSSESDAESNSLKQPASRIQSSPTSPPDAAFSSPRSRTVSPSAQVKHAPPGANLDPSLLIPSFASYPAHTAASPRLHPTMSKLSRDGAPLITAETVIPRKLGKVPSRRRSYHKDGESSSSDEEDRAQELARSFAFNQEQLSSELVSYLSGTVSAADYLHNLVGNSVQGSRCSKTLMQAIALVCDRKGDVYACVPTATPAKPSLVRCHFFLVAAPASALGTDPRMGKVGHPAGLPATSYSTALVFLDQFAQGTGVNVRGLIKLLDDAVVLAKSHVSRSGVALDRQHHTVMGFVASFLQRVLCSALLVAETFDSDHLRSLADCSATSWFSTLFHQQVAPILLVPHGQTHHTVSLRSVLIALGVACPTCGLVGFLPTHCPTTGCYVPRESSASNGEFNAAYGKYARHLDATEPLADGAKRVTASGAERKRLQGIFRDSPEGRLVQSRRSDTRPSVDEAAEFMEDDQAKIPEAEPCSMHEHLRFKYGYFLDKPVTGMSGRRRR